MQVTGEFNRFHVRVETQIYATIYHGREKFCKTEADAREAAELLKQFFEAKAAGKVARLFVDNENDEPVAVNHFIADRVLPSDQRPKNTVIDEMNDAGDKATAGIDMLKHFSEKELQEHKDIVSRHYAQYHESAKSDHHAEAVNKQFDDFEAGLIADRIWGNRANNMTLEQYEVFTIAHNAALIFAHNAHDFDERRSVQSAAKILGYAKEGV